MNTFKVLGHNILTDKWDDLGTIEASTSRGANQKAFKAFGSDYSEFFIGSAN